MKSGNLAYMLVYVPSASLYSSLSRQHGLYRLTDDLASCIAVGS